MVNEALGMGLGIEGPDWENGISPAKNGDRFAFLDGSSPDPSPSQLAKRRHIDNPAMEITTFASLYKVKGLLGSGAFGVVLLAQNR